MKKMAAAFGVALALIALSGCAAPSMTAAHPQTTAPKSSATADIYTLTDAQLQECKQPPLSTRILAEEKADATAVGGRLALPDDMPGASAAQVRAQRKAWEALSTQDRLYQLCLRAADAGELGSLAG